jgi:hypothetical protein
LRKTAAQGRFGAFAIGNWQSAFITSLNSPLQLDDN